MQRDYLLRMVQQMTQIFAKLIGNILGMDLLNFNVEFAEVNEELRTSIGLTVDDIIASEDDEFLDKIKSIGDENTSLLIDLLSGFTEKVIELKKEEEFDLKSLSHKTIVLIDLLEDNTKTFSLERMRLKEKLRSISLDNSDDCES